MSEIIFEFIALAAVALVGSLLLISFTVLLLPVVVAGIALYFSSEYLNYSYEASVGFSMVCLILSMPLWFKLIEILKEKEVKND